MNEIAIVIIIVAISLLALSSFVLTTPKVQTKDICMEFCQFRENVKGYSMLDVEQNAGVCVCANGAIHDFIGLR